MITSFKMALRSIASSKLRAILTMLGIIIGVMALVVLVSLVNGATDSVTGAVADLGTSNITVSISDDKGKPLDLAVLDEWMEDPQIGTLAPQATASGTGRGGGETVSMTVYGTTAGYYEIQGLQLYMGRWLLEPDVENCSYVCILNETAAEKLAGYADCVGSSVTIDNTKFLWWASSTMTRIPSPPSSPPAPAWPTSPIPPPCG